MNVPTECALCGADHGMECQRNCRWTYHDYTRLCPGCNQRLTKAKIEGRADELMAWIRLRRGC